LNYKALVSKRETVKSNSLRAARSGGVPAKMPDSFKKIKI